MFHCAPLSVEKRLSVLQDVFGCRVSPVIPKGILMVLSTYMFLVILKFVTVLSSTDSLLF
jgi:hypothetical protein